jgi:hypothetical protein
MTMSTKGRRWAVLGTALIAVLTASAVSATGAVRTSGATLAANA